ncbi:MAG: hydroxyacid dehydrogenase [Anaerolineae bacterium]|nr:hydroxyacid dehydrogenase [Anaerolineae bacterium]
MNKPVVAITIGKKHYCRMLCPDTLRELESFAHIIHHPGPDPANKFDLINLLPQADACLTSWDVASLDSDVISAAPRLKAVVHMGGSVKRYLSNALWERGIRVFSTSTELGRDVAQTTLGLMIVGMKRVWLLGNHVRNGGWRDSIHFPSRELRGKVVGIIGGGTIGSHVIELLKEFSTTNLLFDPYISEEEACVMGAQKVELDELVKEADIISLHAPANDSTRHIINKRRLGLMKDHALIVNTARGSLIDEAALIEELTNRRIYAILDVTDPEPPAPDSPLRKLENVLITPHIAGCIQDCTHMGKMAIEELRRFFAGEPPLGQVMPEMFDRIS